MSSSLNVVERIRKYFEEGCECVLNGLVRKAPKSLNSDVEGVWNYYNKQCNCGRGWNE